MKEFASTSAGRYQQSIDHKIPFVELLHNKVVEYKTLLAIVDSFEEPSEVIQEVLFRKRSDLRLLLANIGSS